MEKTYKDNWKRAKPISREESRGTRIKLARVLKRKLEGKILEEAFREIKRRGLDVSITDDSEVYKADLRKMRKGEQGVYLLIDKNEYLTDFTPLLPFVSVEKRRTYENVVKILGSY